MEFDQRIDIIRKKLGAGCALDMQERIDLLIRLGEHDKCIEEISALCDIAQKVATVDAQYCIYCEGETYGE